MLSGLLNLCALLSLLVISSSGPAPVAALSIQSPNHLGRSLGHHAVVAKKRATTSRRCKPRPTSTTSKAPASTPKAASPAAKPPASTPPPPANNNNNNNGGTTNTGGGGGKVGLAWPNGDEPDVLKNFKTSKVGAIYSWSPWKPAGSDQLGLEFYPMLWGTKQIGDFTNLVKAGYAHTVLGFNEPDHTGQSNLSPGDAANLWKKYIQPLKSQGYRLVTPAVTSAPSGKDWMHQFFAACTGCTFDALAAHWYGTQASDLIAYLNDFHSTFNLPIMLTEFACQSFTSAPQCSAQQVTDFMNTVTGFMDSTPWVLNYFAFGVTTNMVGVNPDNQLLGGNNLPTPLGYNYIN